MNNSKKLLSMFGISFFMEWILPQYIELNISISEI